MPCVWAQGEEVNTQRVHDRAQEIRLLVSVRQALMWMACNNVPLATGQDPMRAWLDLDRKIEEMKGYEQE